MADVDDDADHARHQAQRGHPGPDHRARARSPNSGWARAARLHDARPARRRPAGAAGVAGDRRHLAGVTGSAARLRREGGARGRDVDDVDRARRRRSSNACTISSIAPPAMQRSAPIVEGLVEATTAAGWSNGLGGQARPADVAGRARRVPGHRAVGHVARRPGQSPPGRLRRAVAPLLARLDGGWLPPVDETGRGQAARHVTCPAPAPRPARAVRRVPAAGRRRRGRRSRDRLRPRRRRHRRHPPVARSRSRDGGWRDTCIVLAPGGVARRHHGHRTTMEA